MAFSKDPLLLNGHSDGPPIRKKIKTSDLPIPSTTRAAIEDLAHKFKKKGGYDSLRKEIWEDLEKSDVEAEISREILAVAEKELENNASTFLKLDRNKAALLLDGVVERTGVYQQAEASIDALIDAKLPGIESGIRALRRADIGEEAAAAEEAKGGKTDEQYAEDARKKREAREKIRQDARDKERAIAEEVARERERRRAARREEEDRLKERERERDRERARDRDRDRDRDHNRGYDRDRERRTDRRSDRDRDRGDGREERDDRHRRRDDDARDRSSVLRDTEEATPNIEPKIELSKEESDRLEQEALNDLLKEGKRTSQRSRHQIEAEVDESLAPPPRKAMPASAIKPISRDSPVKSEAKKVLNAPTGPKADLEAFKTPLLPAGKRIDDKDHVGRDRKRSRSRDRDRSRSRSRRRRDSRDRGSRRGSRDRDNRRNYESRDHDDRRRRDDRDRHRRSDRDHSSERRRWRSRSPDHEKHQRDASRDRVSSAIHRGPQLEQLKLTNMMEREVAAKKWKELQQKHKEEGLPPPIWNDSFERKLEDVQLDPRVASPVSARKRESSRERDRTRDRDRTSRARSRSRSPLGRRGSRIERSTSPVNIDRYVPGASSRRRESTTHKRDRSRSRDRDRDRERDSRRREDDRPRRRSRSRSCSRRREKSRDRYRDRDRKRSRSPDVKKERTYRSRSREKDRDKDRDRRRSRSRDKERDRKRDRSRSRESRRK